MNLGVALPGRPWLRPAIALAAAALVYTAVALVPGGSRPPDMLLSVCAGLALATAIVLVASRMNAGAGAHFAVWFTLIFLNLAAVAVEGTLFAPAVAPPALLGANLGVLAATSAAIAGVVAVLLASRGEPGSARGGSRSWPSWLWRVAAAAAIYFALYFVIGGLNYTLVTRPYYETHAGGLTIPPAQTVFLYEPFRGLLMAVSVLPLIIALRMPARRAAVIAGLLLFVVGGVVPLLPQTALPLYLRLASLWEIFGQNFLLGVACAYLFALPRSDGDAVRHGKGRQQLARGDHADQAVVGNHRQVETADREHPQQRR